MEKKLKIFVNSIYRVLSEVPEEYIESLYNLIIDKTSGDGRIFLVGNGGSQAICNHITTDFAKRLYIQAFSLNSDSMITCYANDYGFENLYSEWLKRYSLTENDIVIGISSSGRSLDIINALKIAQDANSYTVFIYGFEQQKFDKSYDVPIFINSKNYGVVELSTEIILHQIVERLVAENE